MSTSEESRLQPMNAVTPRRQFLRRGVQITAATALTLAVGAESRSRLANPQERKGPAVTLTRPRPQPNILFIIADDLGWTDLSTGNTSKGNGSHFYQTPQIDRFAREGMSFNSCYACQNCQPSRAALMTGQYAPHNGVYNVASLTRGSGPAILQPPGEATRINFEAVTVAKTLQTAGYVTAHVGKFHVSPSPQAILQHYGFDF